jgi:hypothetical protein
MTSLPDHSRVSSSSSTVDAGICDHALTTDGSERFALFLERARRVTYRVALGGFGSRSPEEKSSRIFS